MKTIIELIVIFCGLVQFVSAQSEPQLVQEFTPTGGKVAFVNIDHDTPKIIIEYTNGFDLYNLDYTLYTTVLYPAAFDTIGGRVLYLVTRSLFDCDTSQVEYLISWAIDDNTLGVNILQEDGTEFFSIEGYVYANIGSLTQDPTKHSIVSDEAGSHIVFSTSSWNNATHRLYQLCGQVPQLSARNMDGTVLRTAGPITAQNGFGIYPNPGKDYIRLDYNLEGQNYATVTLFNASGQVVKEVKIGKAFDHIQLDISDLHQGTYIARIVTEDGAQLAEKFVKVE